METKGLRAKNRILKGANFKVSPFLFGISRLGKVFLSIEVWLVSRAGT